MSADISRKITLREMMDHFKVLPNRFDLLAMNAKIDIGNIYVTHYKKSFEIKRFIGSGDPWPERKRSYKHPMMQETGSLKNSISFELVPDYGVRIFTREDELNKNVKRGRKSSYAKFHNDPTGTWGRNVQRKFIGDSTLIEKQVLLRLNKLFKQLGL